MLGIATKAIKLVKVKRTIEKKLRDLLLTPVVAETDAKDVAAIDAEDGDAF